MDDALLATGRRIVPRRRVKLGQRRMIAKLYSTAAFGKLRCGKFDLVNAGQVPKPYSNRFARSATL